MARWISALANALTIVDSIFEQMREVLCIIYQQPQKGECAGGLAPLFAHRGMTGLNIVLTQVAFFTLLFPRVMISSINPAWSLTIYNASSSQYALGVMSIISLIFVPIVLAYEGWSYYIFRKRVKTDKEHLVY